MLAQVQSGIFVLWTNSQRYDEVDQSEYHVRADECEDGNDDDCDRLDSQLSRVAVEEAVGAIRYEGVFAGQTAP